MSATKLLDYDPLLDVGAWKLMPYSVLDTTSTWWRKRRGLWLELGIRGEVQGRAEDLLFSNQKQLLAYDVECTVCARRPPKVASQKRQEDSAAMTLDLDVPQVATTYPHVGEQCVYGASHGCTGVYKPLDKGDAKPSALASGTSIFDPVLCEAIYRWWCPPVGLVLDPFAGGSVRGVVAAKLGRHYDGVELRVEQCEDNRAQYEALQLPGSATWHCDDARNIGMAGWATQYDFILSCPPYYDLEVYSDDARDLSKAGTYKDFRESYFAIITEAVHRLANNRFAVFVVGEIRDKHGRCQGLVRDTELAFLAAGAHLENKAVLVNALGTLPLRIGKQWPAACRLGKHHQEVLVFCKGDAKKAAAAMEPLVLPVDGV